MDQQRPLIASDRRAFSAPRTRVPTTMRLEKMITAGEDIESIESRTGVARDVNSSCGACRAGYGGSFASETDVAVVGQRMVWMVETIRIVKARRKR